jgi:hypothetical protein
MPGLDPGIHPFRKKSRAKSMDRRVKPRSDNGERIAAPLMS